MKRFVFSVSIAAFAATSAWAADAKAGQAVYDKSCKACHGAEGTANPGVAKMMKVEIQDLKSREVQGMSDAEIKNVISMGKGKMKPVSSVTGASLDNVAAYVHTLK